MLNNTYQHEFKVIGAAYYAQLWPQVESYLRRSVSFSGGDVDCSSLLADVASGRQVLVVVESPIDIVAAATVMFINRPFEREAFITAAGGRYITSPEVFEQFKNWARVCGATCIGAAVRPSMQRLLKKVNMQPLHVNVRVKI